MQNTKDAPKSIEFDLEDGNKILMKRKNPYGFLYMELLEGQLPDKYTGAYTTIEAAMESANIYKDERKRALQELKTQNA